MNWLGRVKNNVLPVSIEKTDIRKALDEWVYEGNMYDVEISNEICELCDQPNIRYQFEISNIHNGNALLIGSECITRFQISVINQHGKKLSFDEAKKRVSSDRNKLVTAAKEKSIINSLIELAIVDIEFNIDNFIKYFKERKAFTPNQLVVILWRLDKAKIYFNKSHFKLTIRRDREKDQLLKLEEFKLKSIWPCMSNSQKQFFIKNQQDNTRKFE